MDAVTDPDEDQGFDGGREARCIAIHVVGSGGRGVRVARRRRDFGCEGDHDARSLRGAAGRAGSASAPMAASARLTQTARSYRARAVSRAARPRLVRPFGSVRLRTIAAATAALSKKGTRMPFSPSSIASRTGAVSEATIAQPAAIASTSD